MQGYDAARPSPDHARAMAFADAAANELRAIAKRLHRTNPCEFAAILDEAEQAALASVKGKQSASTSAVDFLLESNAANTKISVVFREIRDSAEFRVGLLPRGSLSMFVDAMTAACASLKGASSHER